MDLSIEVCFHKTISPVQCRDLEECALPPVLAKAEEFVEEARAISMKDGNKCGTVARAIGLSAAGEEIKIEPSGEALYVLWVTTCPRSGHCEVTIYFAPKGAVEEIADNMESDLITSSQKNLEATIVRKKA